MAKHLWAGSGWALKSVSVSERVSVCVLVCSEACLEVGGLWVRNGERQLWLTAPPVSWVAWGGCGGNTLCSKKLFNIQWNEWKDGQ